MESDETTSPSCLSLTLSSRPKETSVILRRRSLRSSRLEPKKGQKGFKAQPVRIATRFSNCAPDRIAPRLPPSLVTLPPTECLAIVYVKHEYVHLLPRSMSRSSDGHPRSRGTWARGRHHKQTFLHSCMIRLVAEPATGLPAATPHAAME